MEILLIEDEKTLAEPLGDALRDVGHSVTVLHDGGAALAWLADGAADLVVSDIRLPKADGLEILRRARSLDPPADVILMTGFATVEQAVAAMESGAWSYLQKPFPTAALTSQVERVAATRALRREVEELRSGEGIEDDLGLVGTSAAIEALRSRVRTIADSDATVLIQGPSGSGKERTARALHRAGRRAAEPFVAVSCAAIPESMLESELFGHEKGAFTGAERAHTGHFVRADRGTLFLDDVDDIPLPFQVRLLRALQEREVTPLGAETAQPFDVRLVAATKADLQQVVVEEAFREDLYFRLAVVPLTLPSLADRIEDLPLLLAHFLRREDPTGRAEITREALRELAAHDWPGNVRELENAVVRAVALAGKSRQLRSEHFMPGGALAQRLTRPEEVRPLGEVVREAERRAIRLALAQTGGRKGEAASLLGISRKGFWRKCLDLGLEPPSEQA